MPDLKVIIGVLRDTFIKNNPTNLCTYYNIM